MSEKIKPEQLAATLEKLFDKYADDVYDIVEGSAKSAARGATSELRRISPGEYARKWRHKPTKGKRVRFSETVYNTKYQLTHLLEKPHVTGRKRGGHYPAHTGSAQDHTGDIAGVESKYSKKFFNDLVKKL